MYNGIGLSTARGSGTNGYVQRNLSSLRPRERKQDMPFEEQRPPQIRKPNQEILEHEKKRQVEVQCLMLQEQLESQGVSEEDIEARVSNLRKQLLENLDRMRQDAKKLQEHQVHQLAEAKEKADARAKIAFGIADDFVAGAAFDRELQERLKQERIQERERREEQRKQRLEDMEKQRKKEAKQAVKVLKKAQEEREKWEKERQREQAIGAERGREDHRRYGGYAMHAQARDNRLRSPSNSDDDRDYQRNRYRHDERHYGRDERDRRPRSPPRREGERHGRRRSPTPPDDRRRPRKRSPSSDSGRSLSRDRRPSDNRRAPRRGQEMKRNDYRDGNRLESPSRSRSRSRSSKNRSRSPAPRYTDRRVKSRSPPAQYERRRNGSPRRYSKSKEAQPRRARSPTPSPSRSRSPNRASRSPHGRKKLPRQPRSPSSSRSPSPRRDRIPDKKDEARRRPRSPSPIKGAQKLPASDSGAQNNKAEPFVHPDRQPFIHPDRRIHHEKPDKAAPIRGDFRKPAEVVRPSQGTRADSPRGRASPLRRDRHRGQKRARSRSRSSSRDSAPIKRGRRRAASASESSRASSSSRSRSRSVSVSSSDRSRSPSSSRSRSPRRR